MRTSEGVKVVACLCFAASSDGAADGRWIPANSTMDCPRTELC